MSPEKPIGKPITVSLIQGNIPQDEKWLVEKRFVVPGSYYNEIVEIRDGLSEDENVVVFGFQDLADGQTVQLGDE